MKNIKLCIIGGGNLGTSIANGLISSNINPSNITVTKRRVKAINYLKKKGVKTSTNNIHSIKNANFYHKKIKLL